MKIASVSPIQPILSVEEPLEKDSEDINQTTDMLMFQLAPHPNPHQFETEYYSPQELNFGSKFGCKNRKLFASKLHPKGGDDLFAVLRVPLIIGAWLGLIPIRGLWQKNFQAGKQVFTWLHLRTLISIIATSLILIHTFFITHSFFLGIMSKQNSAGALVLSFSGVWFYSVGTLVYAFFLLRSKRLCEYFRTWATVSEEISDTLQPDWNICRDVNLICILVLLDALGENTLYHFHAMDPVKRSRMYSLTLGDVLKDYFDSNQYIYPFSSYNVPVALALLFTNKLTTYAWNFGDIFLMVISRALYARYASLNRYLESLMVPDGSVNFIKKGTVHWENVRRNFLLITKLLEEGNKLLSPLLWLSYITDIFFVCRQLYEGLAPAKSKRFAINKVYVAWSLFHLTIRTIGVNWMAARINEHAHRISKILQHCYPEEYDDNVRRLERYIGSKIIGMTGNGCFIITRSFILMVMSAIFTLEVVLLQNASITVG